MRFGLVANRRHRETIQGGLAYWTQRCQRSLLTLQLELQVVGGTYDALIELALLEECPRLLKLPYGADGGVMRLASRVAGGLSSEEELDGAIYLVDPIDASSMYPEAAALKRQCVIHGKPFIATVAGAVEWIGIEMVHAGFAPDSPLPSPEGQTLALIAHDAFKSQMVDFAATHFDLLSRYAHRVGTGTTGARLNEMAVARGWPADRPWVERYLSGPMGGDAQIAERVLERRCHKVIFFEDPHVARQHEADIQLLERAVSTATFDTTCFNSPAMAQRWAVAMTAIAASSP